MSGHLATVTQFLQTGMNYYSAGRPEIGRRVIATVVIELPAEMEAYRIWSIMLSQTGAYREALSLALRACHLAPESSAARQTFEVVQIAAFNAFITKYKDDDPAELPPIMSGFLAIPRDVLMPQVVETAPMLLNNAGQVLLGQGAWAKAMQCVDIALHLAPDLKAAVLQRAYMHLVVKDYRKAWNPVIWKRVFSGHGIWDGEQRAARLFVYNSNGFGDFIQFMRFLPNARSRVETLHVTISPQMRCIVGNSPALDGVQVTYGRANFPWDAGCDIIALPFAMGLTPDDATLRSGYLSSPPALTEHWSSLLSQEPGLRVGIIWARSGDDRQSIGLANIERLFTISGVRYFGLQNNEAKRELFGAYLADCFTDLGLYDWGHVAAVMNSVDLVIAPDCGLAHLAAALGRPTWVVLQRYSEWRWTWEGETSDWYPNVRIFRQDEEGDWPSAIAKVETALRELVGA